MVLGRGLDLRSKAEAVMASLVQIPQEGRLLCLFLSTKTQRMDSNPGSENWYSLALPLCPA